MTTPPIHYNKMCSDLSPAASSRTSWLKPGYPKVTLPVSGGNGGKGAVGFINATLPLSGGNGGSGAVGFITATLLPVSGGNGGSGAVGFITATLPVSGGNGGSGAVGFITATLPVSGGNGGSGAVGFVTVDASAEAVAMEAKLATRTAARSLTKLASIEVYLLSSEKKLSW
ncbi:MAG: hypothetical protein WAL75_26195 [Terracidiphilus sp.]